MKTFYMSHRVEVISALLSLVFVALCVNAVLLKNASVSARAAAYREFETKCTSERGRPVNYPSDDEWICVFKDGTISRMHYR